jgi:hypothetical protein
LEKHAVSIIRADKSSVLNETKVVGNRSAQFHVTTVAQLVTACDLQSKKLAFYFKSVSSFIKPILYD